MRRLPFPAAAAALVLLLASAAPLAAAETVAHRVFEAGLLADVAKPTVLRYRFELQGKAIDPPYRSHVDMDVREVGTDGEKKVFFDMFEGANRRQFGPMAAREQNPLVIVFLQRDVNQMGNLTGGSAFYFQQQIRKAFNDPAEVEAVEVSVDDRKLPATRLVIRPFRNDPQIERFPRFKDKAYEFVVAEGVPGGLYRIASRTPDPGDGHLILEESMTFEEVVP
ncbi:hypothetical protein [Benzoatithermus flavus]|uniref:DUF3108 domain-containing protein n=1 Tax=Benzoatithermus flavus TaxID=3108223 RepID=A0ABU8XQ95_9PROT